MPFFVHAASKAIFRKEQTRGNPGAQSHGAVKAAGRSAEENTSNTTPIFGVRWGFLFLWSGAQATKTRNLRKREAIHQ
jgi:hypothetical protein